MAELTTTLTRPTTSIIDAVHGYRCSPAGDLTEEMARGSGVGVRLREIPFLTQTALRATPGSAAADALAAALGIALPARAGQVTGSADGRGERAVLWLAPDEFLVVGRDEAVSGVATTAFAAGLAASLAEQPGQVVDVSANRATLELSGPRAREVLDKSCQLDLHPREFPVGCAVVTLLESVGVIIWRTGEETWRIMPRASFSTHVVRWLLDGMREFR
jgi:sarcosine oxidase, subunit gamma